MWVKKQLVTINNGESLSNAYDLGSMHVLSMKFPAGFQGIVVTFEVSEDGQDFDTLLNENGEVREFAVSTEGLLPVSAHISICFNHLKIRSGTPSAPVNQTSDVSISLGIGTL